MVDLRSNPAMKLSGATFEDFFRREGLLGEILGGVRR